jgi:hypothetical protein
MENELEYTMTLERKYELTKEFGLAWSIVISPVEFALMDALSLLHEGLKALARSSKI